MVKVSDIVKRFSESKCIDLKIDCSLPDEEIFIDYDGRNGISEEYMNWKVEHIDVDGDVLVLTVA